MDGLSSWKALKWDAFSVTDLIASVRWNTAATMASFFCSFNICCLDFSNRKDRCRKSGSHGQGRATCMISVSWSERGLKNRKLRWEGIGYGWRSRKPCAAIRCFAVSPFRRLRLASISPLYFHPKRALRMTVLGWEMVFFVKLLPFSLGKLEKSPFLEAVVSFDSRNSAGPSRDPSVLSKDLSSHSVQLNVEVTPAGESHSEN